MTSIEFRKLQESVANILVVKDEIAKATYGIYQALIKEGFTKKEAMELTKHLIKGEKND